MLGKSVVVGRIQLLSQCTLCPTSAVDKIWRKVELSLLHSSAFEQVDPTPGSFMLNTCHSAVAKHTSSTTLPAQQPEPELLYQVSTSVSQKSGWFL